MTDITAEMIGMLNRLVELVKEDPPLHDAIVKLVDSMTDSQKAKAEYTRSRIK